MSDLEIRISMNIVITEDLIESIFETLMTRGCIDYWFFFKRIPKVEAFKIGVEAIIGKEKCEIDNKGMPNLYLNRETLTKGIRRGIELGYLFDCLRINTYGRMDIEAGLLDQEKCDIIAQLAVLPTLTYS